MPTFDGDKKTYQSFMTIFEAWEDKEDIRRATSSAAMLIDLPTDQEYWDGSRRVEFTDANGSTS